MGATVIEKHFTLDRSLPGPDHGASLEPDELTAMVQSIRNIEVAFGDGIKKPTPSESKNIRIVRKSIVAATSIKEGELFSETNLTAKRPGTGISPMRWDEMMGQTATRAYEVDELIDA
jgi:N,N'-diacetyllegionaminate synthase